MMKTVIILAALFCSGCAGLPAGVTMDDQERAACAAEGCTVWTVRELQILSRMVVQQTCRRGTGI